MARVCFQERRDSEIIKGNRRIGRPKNWWLDVIKSATKRTCISVEDVRYRVKCKLRSKVANSKYLREKAKEKKTILILIENIILSNTLKMTFSRG